MEYQIINMNIHIYLFTLNAQESGWVSFMTPDTYFSAPFLLGRLRVKDIRFMTEHDKDWAEQKAMLSLFNNKLPHNINIVKHQLYF